MQEINIGVDVGNYDTKTQHTTMVSGYKKYESKPELADKILFYKGFYYVPDINERMPYMADKTQNDSCLILTLFGIAEELLHMAKDSNKDSVQVTLDKYRHIKLGIGLPPGHINKYSKKTIEYYEEKLAGSVEFIYKNYRYMFEVDSIRLFPQDFVAVFKNPHCETAKKKRYYIVGIGGGTTDIVPVINGKPDVNNCFSLEMGTRVMYRKIAANIQREFGEMLDEGLVEDVLKEEDNLLPEDMKRIIKENGKEFYNAIINGCIGQGVKLSLYPTVFFGGGALLLREFIEEDEKLAGPEILGDIHANAKAYAQCMGI